MYDYLDPDEPHYLLVSGPADAGVDYWACQLRWAKRAEKSWQEYLARKGYGKTSDDDSQ